MIPTIPIAVAVAELQWNYGAKSSYTTHRAKPHGTIRAKARKQYLAGKIEPIWLAA